jgi:uncharacterized protein YjdB
VNISRIRILAAAAAVVAGAVACSDALRPVELHTIEVSAAAPQLMVGDTMRLAATVRDAAGQALAQQPVRWSSSDTTVLTVDANGLLLSRGPGSATITAASDGALDAAIGVTVLPRKGMPTAFTVTPDAYTVGVGRSMQLFSTAVMPSGDTAIQMGRWSSSDPAKVSVSETGVVTGVGGGSAVITASYGGRQASVTVHTGAPVGKILIVTWSQHTIRMGDSTTLPFGLYEGGAGVTPPVTGERQLHWTSSNPAVATVSDFGVVHGVGPGTAVVTLSSEGVASHDSITFTVVGPAATVRFLPDSMLVRRADTITSAQPEARDANGVAIGGARFSFTISDTSVALIGAVYNSEPSPGMTANGTAVVLYVRAPGTAQVVAELDGVRDTLHVRVLPPLTLEVSPAAVTLQQGSTRDFTVVARDPQGQPVTGLAVIWSSSNLGVVTIAGDGVATARGPGTATITASVYGYQGTAQVTVPGTVSTTGNWASVSAGGRHTCGITKQGAVYCWGSNDAAQLGTGNLQNNNVPVAIAGGGTYAQVSAGTAGSCALTAPGDAFCWGNGGHPGTGQRGPLAVPGAPKFTTLDAGDSYQLACGLRTDGGMSCWEFWTAAAYERPGTFRAVAGGHPCGVLADDSGVQCWAQRTGLNQMLEGASGTLVGIDGGPYSTCVWNTAGQAFCTTMYTHGAGGSSSISSFAQITGNAVFTQVSVGGSQGCGVTADGTAYCWPITTGSGAFFGVSHGTPVQVGGSLRFSTVSAGDNHACGVTTGGAAFCWGSNQYGQLGLGFTGGAGGEPARVVDP